MTKRIGLIVPASNTAAETQFQRYAPAGVSVHATRLRMTGKWSRPRSELADDITRAAEALSDTSPGVIVFHCTANSMAEGQDGEARILELVEKATNEHEIEFLGQAGYEVIHDLGLGLTGGGDEYLRITPREWTDLTVENRRAAADGYFLSCTATSMIDAIEDVERSLDKPVVNSNQAVLWAALRRLDVTEPVAGVGRLFDSESRV